MEAIIILVCIAFAFWSIRSICLKPQSKVPKTWKSVFSGWYFLAAAMVTPGSEITGAIMLLIGIAITYYTNRKNTFVRTPKPSPSLHDNSSLKKINKPLRLNNAKNKKAKAKNTVTSDLYQIAFLYINSNDVEKFGDVDIKSLDRNYLEGYRYVANNFRTFVLNRIEGNIITRSSDEFLDPYVWAEKLVTE